MSNDTVPASAEGLPNPGLDAELIKLGGELEEVHRHRLEIESKPEDDPKVDVVYTAHWGLREKIEALPATTDAGRRVKARAIETALHFDPKIECDMPGSFATLSQSLCRDLLTAPPVAPSIDNARDATLQRLEHNVEDVSAAVITANYLIDHLIINEAVVEDGRAVVELRTDDLTALVYAMKTVTREAESLSDSFHKEWEGLRQ
jgi:DNA-directed RNA polymerase subunit L